MPGCEHLCHWYRDDAAKSERHVLVGLPCTHRQIPYMSGPDVVEVGGHRVPADPEWTVTRHARIVAMLGSTHHKIVVTFPGEERAKMLEAMG